jgi:hypothetical protein
VEKQGKPVCVKFYTQVKINACWALGLSRTEFVTKRLFFGSTVPRTALGLVSMGKGERERGEGGHSCLPRARKEGKTRKSSKRGAIPSFPGGQKPDDRFVPMLILLTHPVLS